MASSIMDEEMSGFGQPLEAGIYVDHVQEWQ